MLSDKLDKDVDLLAVQRAIMTSVASRFVHLLRSRMSNITLESHVIQHLSALMRQHKDPATQDVILQVWLSEVRQTSDPTRLLGLCYLANDVIQHLRGSKESIIYRYNFIAPLAQAFVVIRQKACILVPKIARLVAIFEDRLIYDTETLSLLQKVLQEDICVVISTVIPVLVNGTTAVRDHRIAQLEMEAMKKRKNTEKAEHQVGRNGVSSNSLPSATQPLSLMQSYALVSDRSPANVPDTHCSALSGATVSPGPPAALGSSEVEPQHLPQIVSFSDSSLDEKQYANALKKLKRSIFNYDSRPPTNDAAILSRIKQYQSTVNASASPTDIAFLVSFNALLSANVKCRQSIEEKMNRRRKELDRSRSCLTLSNTEEHQGTSSVSLIEVLLRKEWSLRCYKAQLEHGLYCHLFDFMKYLIERSDRFNNTIHTIQMEMQRRSHTSDSVTFEN